MTDGISSNLLKLREHSVFVYQRLMDYTAWHDYLHRMQGTWWSVVKNLLGIGHIPFAELAEQTDDLKNEWIALVEAIDDFRIEILSDATPLEREFVDCLLEYTTAVARAVELLGGRQQFLRMKAESPQAPDLSKAKYRDKQNQYCQAVAHYQQIGVALNAFNARFNP